MTAPQRIMIIAWGSRGDLQPVTALALRLMSQGREVLVFGTPPATELLQANGVSCIAAHENVEDVMYVDAFSNHALFLSIQAYRDGGDT